MRKMLFFVFGLFISLAAIEAAPQAVTAAPVSVGGIKAAEPVRAEQAQYVYRRYGYRRPVYRGYRYGYRRPIYRGYRYGYRRPFYRPYGYGYRRPFYGPYGYRRFGY